MIGAALVVVWAWVAERCIRDRPWRRLASQWTQMAEQGIDERRTLRRSLDSIRLDISRLR